MDLQTLHYSLDEDGIALITINRPEKLNALNARVIDELDQCFGEARSDNAVKGIILTGAGEKSFVAGADIKQFADLDAVSGHRFSLHGQVVYNHIEEMPIPVVAAVNGYALGGGCELAMACHLRVASENARFGQPEVKLGTIPGYGGTQRLPRLVGLGPATELILTGAPIDSKRAYEIGLVNLVVPLEELIPASKKMIKNILSNGPIAVSLSLEALRHSHLPLHEGLRYEASLFSQTCATQDFKEGAAAFVERRKADFQGKG